MIVIQLRTFWEHPFLSIFLFTLASVSSIYFISIYLFKKGVRNPFQRNIISFSFYILFLGFSAFALILFELYRLDRVIFSLFLLSLALVVYIAITKTPFALNPFSPSPRRIDKAASIGGSALLLLALFLFSFFPTEDIKGNRDHGLYLLFGVKIAKTGGLNFQDPFYEKLTQDIGSAITVGYPSISEDSQDRKPVSKGDLSPRFFPLFPCYVAIAYDLFGMDGAFRVNAIFGTLSVAFIFLIARRILGTYGGLTAMLLCTINPAEIWNVRSTLSEPLGQFLIVFSIYLTQTFLLKKKYSPMFLIGCILGLSTFNRIDSLIYLPAIVFFVVYLSYRDEKQLKKGLSLLSGFLLFCLMGFLYGWIFSRPYLKDLWQLKLLLNLFLLSVASLFFLGIAIFVLKAKFTRPWIEECRKFVSSREKLLRIGFAAFLFLTIVFMLFIRHQLPLKPRQNLAESLFRANSLSIFFFYVPSLLFLFGIKGYDLLLWKRKHIKSSFFLFIGTFLLAIYLYEPSIAPDHYWASRRWFLFSIPFSIILGLIGLFSIPIRKPIWKNALILFVLFGSCFYFYKRTRLIILDPMLAGYSEEYDRIAKTLPSENSIYFTRNAELAGPLRYIYDKKTYLLNNTNQFLSKSEKLISSGLDVYIIDYDPDIRFEGLSFDKIEQIHLQGDYPVERVNRYPNMILNKTLNFSVYKISANKGPRKPQNFTGKAIAGDSPSVISLASKADRELKSNDFEETFVYRSFLPLPEGKYKIGFFGKNLTEARFSSTANDSFVLSPVVKGSGTDEIREIVIINERSDMDDIQIVFHKLKDTEASLSRILVSKLE